ncbi:hypothetical protein HHI36_014067, partial [Cryptolaemus montrouzieri]
LKFPYLWCVDLLVNSAMVSYSVEPDDPIPRIRLPGALQSLESIEFSEEEGLSYLASLDVSTSSGVDNLSARLLKSCEPALSYPLTKILTLSFETSTLSPSGKQLE